MLLPELNFNFTSLCFIYGDYMSIVKKVVFEMVNHVKKMRSQDAPVKPGQPERFTEACTVGDTIAQGDVNFILAEKRHLPSDYVPWENIPDNLQLVHGSDIGSMHCLDSMEGVEAYVPNNWSAASLRGPFLMLSQERTAPHPKHGNVTFTKDSCIMVTYQRNQGLEQKIMRAKD
jgi:hypothetical protein